MTALIPLTKAWGFSFVHSEFQLENEQFTLLIICFRFVYFNHSNKLINLISTFSILFQRNNIVSKVPVDIFWFEKSHPIVYLNICKTRFSHCKVNTVSYNNKVILQKQLPKQKPTVKIDFIQNADWNRINHWLWLKVNLLDEMITISNSDSQHRIKIYKHFIRVSNQAEEKEFRENKF